MFIIFENENLCPLATELGRELLLPVYSKEQERPPSKTPKPYAFLILTEKHLGLQQSDNETDPFFIDFNDKELTYRTQRSTRKNEAIAKAVGLKKNNNPVVFDLTAGLGRDAFILAQLGCTLHLFERNKIIAALLRDGLNRASKRNFTNGVEQMTLHTGDALKLLANIAKDFPPDVLYLDPMFPQRTKTALVKKEMRIIRSLVGDDHDSALLFLEAQKYARDRVVCKRPRQAPFVCGSPPSMSIRTKKHRFDVYLAHKNLKLKT